MKRMGYTVVELLIVLWGLIVLVAVSYLFYMVIMALHKYVSA